MNEKLTSLQETRRHRLIEESIREFGEHGYAGASTNRIVERAGISKGSLFHYFGTKQGLYLALLDMAAEEIRSAFEAAAGAGTEDLLENFPSEKLPSDPVERIIALAKLEFRFYTSRPELYRLFRRAVSDPDTSELVRKRYDKEGMAIFQDSLNGAAFAEEIDKSAAIAVLAWVVNGFNEAFFPTTGTTDDPAEVMHRYETELGRYLSVIAPCVRGTTDKPNTGGTR